MKRILWAIYVLLFLLLLHMTSALTVNGQKLSPIIFEPGKIIINHYMIEDTTNPIEVSVSGDLMEYITVTKVVNNQFDLVIAFPETFIAPGSYSFILSVREVGGSSSGIGSLLSVTKVFTIEVYSHEKEIEASLGAGNTNLGDRVPFHVTVKSRTYADIEHVQGVIHVFDSHNKSVGEVTTSAILLAALSEQFLEATFPTTGLTADEYHAFALVSYDGKKKQTGNTTFRIGEMNLLLKNYTTMLHPGFSEFSVLVENAWGKELHNVYLTLSMNGEEVLQTPITMVGPWEEKTLKGIVKVLLPIGNYSGTLKLFFEGEQKEHTIALHVREAPPLELKNIFPWLTITVILAIVLVSLAIGIVVLYKKRRQRNNDI